MKIFGRGKFDIARNSCCQCRYGCDGGGSDVFRLRVTRKVITGVDLQELRALYRGAFPENFPSNGSGGESANGVQKRIC